jgi:hypothetical protein
VNKKYGVTYRASIVELVLWSSLSQAYLAGWEGLHAPMNSKPCRKQPGCWYGHLCRTGFERGAGQRHTLAIHFGGWAWDWHPHLVKTQLSRNLGKGEAMARKWSRTAIEEECSVKRRVVVNPSHNLNLNDSSTKVHFLFNWRHINVSHNASNARTYTLRNKN